MEISLSLAYGVRRNISIYDINLYIGDCNKKMSNNFSIKSLKLQGVWLIALMFLALNLPSTHLVNTSVNKGSSPFELTAQTWGFILQWVPIEPVNNREHAKIYSELELISPDILFTTLVAQYSEVLLHIIIDPYWVAWTHPLSLPRPPPSHA